MRPQIGVVAHDPHLFNLTIRDNLLLARPDASQDALEAACRTAGIHDFIIALPAWLTRPGSAKGACGSAGASARGWRFPRAVKDAPIVILDEPTAHLDVEAERQRGRGTWHESCRPHDAAHHPSPPVCRGRRSDRRGGWRPGHRPGAARRTADRCAVYRALVDGAAASQGQAVSCSRRPSADRTLPGHHRQRRVPSSGTTRPIHRHDGHLACGHAQPLQQSRSAGGRGQQANPATPVSAHHTS